MTIVIYNYIHSYIEKHSLQLRQHLPSHIHPIESYHANSFLPLWIIGLQCNKDVSIVERVFLLVTDLMKRR